MKNIYFVINPQAKNGYCQKVWRKLEKILLEKNITYMAFFTEYSGHAKEITQMIARRAEGTEVIVVAVGGDGTMNEVINGAACLQNVKVAFIPGGSGNDFSRGFGVRKNPVHAFYELIERLEQEATLVDTGKIMKKDKEDIYFVNNMGVGLDALVSRDVNRSKMKRVLNRLSLGKFVYVYFLMKNLFTYKCTTVEIKIDGKSYLFDSAWFVTVSNQPFYGGGMKISPDASPFDGLLNITVVHNVSRLKLLFLFITVFWGGHTSIKEVEMFIGRTVSIHSINPLYAHADGEDIGCSPLKIAACTRNLSLIISSATKEDYYSDIIL